MIPRTGDSWAYADHQGTVGTWGVEDANGYHLSHTKYNSFGTPVGGTITDDAAGLFASLNAGLPVIWAGHRVNSDVHLTDMQARWRDTGAGVFLSEDPNSFAAGDTNLYRYGQNSPGNFVDPSGQVIETVWDGISIFVGLASVGSDIYRIATTGSGWSDLGLDAIGLGADILAALLPGVPGGVSIARKAGRAVGAVDLAHTAVRGLRVADTIGNAYQGAYYGSYAYESGDKLGFALNGISGFLGFAGLTTRGFQGLAAAGYHVRTAGIYGGLPG
ncbi:MAG: RHS repeat-associated core domain-containing protein [Planctomycetaceae bacterium]